MTPASDSWLRELLREGADDLTVPPDLTDTVVHQTLSSQQRTGWVRPVLQVGLVAMVVTIGVVAVAALRSNTAAPPVGAPTPELDTAVVGAPSSLLGTWELKRMSGFTVPDGPPRGEGIGPLITFQTDGTWSGFDGCNPVSGGYDLQPDGTFASTVSSTGLAACPEVASLPLPANEGTEVRVHDGEATFYDSVGATTARLVRPLGWSAPTARLLTTGWGIDLALSTYGSGSCPYEIDSIQVKPDNQLWVQIADLHPGAVCTADFRRSTDVAQVPIPIDPDPVIPTVDPTQPVTATLVGLGQIPTLTVPVDASDLVGARLVTVKDWDGTSVDTARLEGTLTVNGPGCVSVGNTVVAWPSTYRLATEPNRRFAIVDQDGTTLGTEGQTLTLAGGMTPAEQDGTTTVDTTHPECITGDYWTGVIFAADN